LALGIIDHLEPAMVRGQRAFIGRNTRTFGDKSVTQTTLAWYDHPGQLITVAGATSAETLENVANGLRHATATEWRDVVANLTSTTRP
jgi:hypothetical protein